MPSIVGSEMCIRDSIDALHRQHIDTRKIACRPREAVMNRRAVDDQSRDKAKFGEARLKLFGLALFELAIVEHDEHVSLHLGRQRMLQRQCPHLLRQIDGMAARLWPERLAAAAENRRLLAAVTRAAGPLLPIHLSSGRVDLRAVLDRNRATPALGELIAHHAMEQVGACLLYTSDAADEEDSV